MNSEHDKEKLEQFFRTVAHLTLNHDCIGNYATVRPFLLGKALEAVDPEWWKSVPPLTSSKKSV